jgi:hypothetical protein
MRSHRSSPRSSLHTSLVNSLDGGEDEDDEDDDEDDEDDDDALGAVNPPHTTSPGRVRSPSVAPSREALHTVVSLNASTRLRCGSMRAHSSGRAATRAAGAESSYSSGGMVVAMILEEEEPGGRLCARA